MDKKFQKKTFFIILLVFAVTVFGTLENQTKFSPRLLNHMQKTEIHQPITAWIYFADKGSGLKQKMAVAEMNLSDRCFQRRLRHGLESNMVDFFDIPVTSSYTDRLKKMVKRVRHKSRWLNAMSVEATADQLKEIARFPFVKKIDKVIVYHHPIEPGIKMSPVSPPLPVDTKILQLDYGESFTQLNQLNVPRMHDLGYSGKGVLICMLDSGFKNLSHEALDHINIVETWDFVNNDAQVFDEPDDMGTGNHGTWTLGTIAGFQPGELIGPAFNASFLLGKTENNEWERHIEEDHWVAGAEWAEKNGVDIISSSLGYRDQFTNNETDYAWTDLDGETTVVSQGANIAASKGVFLVNSAGNEGEAYPPQNTLVSPSDCERVLAAGAIDPFGDRAAFSSTGPTADGRIKPDVMAMGQWVYTADITGNNYTHINGTSFSCPLSAGVAALILEARPAWTNWQIMDAMKNTASQANAPDFYYGWGVLNANKAISYQQKEVFPPLDFSIQNLENNFIFFFEYINRLTWKPNVRNTKQIRYYRLYKKPVNGNSQSFELVAQLDNNVTGFDIRGLKWNEVFLYKITAVDGSGKESDPNYTRGWEIIDLDLID